LFPKGLSPKLKTAFPVYTIVEAPIFIPSIELLNPNWIAGFTNADGSFTLGY